MAQLPDGPVVVVGRPRSGTRLLAQLLRLNGVFIGADCSDGYLDSIAWYQRFVVPLVTSRFFPEWPAGGALDALVDGRLRDAWPRYCGGEAPEGPFGWKHGETLFVMPLVARLFPGARFVHVVRDGRDVCLSRHGYWQLTGPPGDATFRSFCRAVTFEDPCARSWRGIDLADPPQLVENRFLLQMQSWIACVTRARRYGRTLGDAYVEVRYEELCADPGGTSRALLERLGLRARHLLGREVTADRVGAWRRERLSMREARDLDRALEHGAPLLAELGYAA